MPEAKGKAKRILEEAKAYRDSTIARADGAGTVDAHGAGESSYSSDAFELNNTSVFASAIKVTTGSSYTTWFCGCPSNLEIDSEL